LNTAAVFTVATNLAGVDGILETLGHCIAICERLVLKVCMYSMFVKQYPFKYSLFQKHNNSETRYPRKTKH
jgi:hypothetical protein